MATLNQSRIEDALKRYREENTSEFKRNAKLKEFAAAYESESYMLCRLLATRYNFTQSGVTSFYKIYQQHIRKNLEQFIRVELGSFGVLIPYFEKMGRACIYEPGCIVQVDRNYMADLQAKLYDDPGLFDRFYNAPPECEQELVVPTEVITFADLLLSLKQESGLMAGEIKRYTDKIHEVWLEYIAKKSYMHMSVGKFIMYKRRRESEEVGGVTKETIDLYVMSAYEPSFRYSVPARICKVPWPRWKCVQDIGVEKNEGHDDSIAGL